MKKQKHKTFIEKHPLALILCAPVAIAIQVVQESNYEYEKKQAKKRKKARGEEWRKSYEWWASL